MTICKINEGLKKAVKYSLVHGDFASLPKCIQRTETELFMKYDEIQLKINEDCICIHQCYKNEVLNSTQFLLRNQSIENLDSLCLYDLNILMKSGKKANAIEIDFKNSSRVKISLLKIKKKNNQKKVRLVQQYNRILKDKYSFSEFQFGLHQLHLT